MEKQYSDKSLTCLCLHFIEFQKSYRDKKAAELDTPCRRCKYNKTCKFDWLDIINEIVEDVTGEALSYFLSLDCFNRR